MAEFVVGSDGTLGNLPRRKAKSVRQYAAKEDWKRQKTKEVGCKLDRIASVFQEAAQCCGGIPPRVACQHVFARPEPLVSWDGEVHPPSGNDESIDSGQEAAVVTDVLDNIKQAHRWKSLRQHPSVLQGRPHDLAYAAVEGVSNPRKSRFHEDHFQPGLLNRPGNVTIPAANIKERTGWREKLDRCENTAIPVSKPKRRVFDREA